ncbi:T9SS type A sorting domain-containing protein [Polaribacter sp. MSW13]|uniref:T9SS type A sorting domain-containing protein n=1 Tax=Polaribacter marinus TaxID=2916838 RepID=A0A9X1VP76_9FLAO|nr:T9SS type A sorting domain-containing protein [Polaribacter marinus]MCI2229847.1 T9SS type A sorting domain-containing protein [Polaribacter marinus]
MAFVQLNGQNNLNLDASASPRFTVTDKVWPANVGEADVCLWNDDKLAAFTVTIDDNNEQDIPFWKSMITKYGFHFTWFVINQADSQYNVQDWSLFNDLANMGSQIDGHDDRNWYNNPTGGETNPTDADYLARLQATKTKINTEVTSGNNNNLTYAYPFGEGNETEARKVFIGIRGTNGILNQANSVNYLDVNSVSNPHIYGNDTDRDKYILPILDKVSKLYGVNYYRGWASTHFHGLDAAQETLADEFLQYLADKPDIWVAGFTEVTQYSQSFATHNLTVDSVSGTEIKFTLTDDMLNTAFYFPLSVKIRIDNSWSTVSAIQNGVAVDTQIITNNGNRYAIVKAVPDLGQVTVTGIVDADPAIINPTIGNQAMIEEATLQIDFSASTTGSDAITFTVSNLPSFGVFTDNGDNSGKIVFSPAIADAGDYQNIAIIADNGRSVSSQSFQLTVSPNSGGEPTTEYTINPTGDGIISDVANLAEGNTNPWLSGNDVDGTKVLKLGQSASTGAPYTTNAILPFQLPVRPAGKLVTSANLKINVAYLRHWVSSDIDLYGLPYSTSNTISPSNFYDGTFSDPESTVTGIQDAYFVRDVSGAEPTGTEILTDREVNSNSNGDTALAAYINAQYDAGAVAGDYIFLRLSIDATSGSTGSHYYGISDESTAEAPVLTLEIENVLGVDSYDLSEMKLSPNPVKDGQLTILSDDIELNNVNVAIYTLTGSLVHKEMIANNSDKRYNLSIHLKPGIYIVKLTNGKKIKTQKLIVQ